MLVEKELMLKEHLPELTKEWRLTPSVRTTAIIFLTSFWTEVA